MHSSCSWRQIQLKDPIYAFSFKSKKTLFSATAKKASFGLEKLIICFPVRLCVRDKLRAEGKLSGKPITFYLLRSEMQTSSATGWLLQRDGSFYLTKVFGIDDIPCFLVTPSDNVHLITNKFKGLPTLVDKTRIVRLK